ncbi:MAG: DNA primase [Alistipes putredinis]|nr:MAG: DNA primase [Alistipes putredinis]
MIDQATIDRIYAAADIVDVISDYVSLRKKGANYQACCPFHNEKTPSFIVSPAKGLFKCFGCGKGGNAVTFVMEHEGMNYVEALKNGCKKIQYRSPRKRAFGRGNPEERRPREHDGAQQPSRRTISRKRCARRKAKAWVSAIFHERGFYRCDYREIRSGVLSARRSFHESGTRSGLQGRIFLTSTGLSIKRDDGTLFDRFSERVMFPIHTISGRVLAFGGRTLRTDKVVAKYQNSPESEIYSKKMTLYGIFFAKKAISQLQCAILVEGYTDVISMHQAGVENVVASSGTSLTTEQVKLLKRFTDNITVIYDGDSAGIKAALRGIDMILREGMNVRVVLLPKDEDPDSFAKSHTAEQVQDYIRANEEDFITFKSKPLMRECGGDVIKRAAVITDMVQSIAEIPDAIPRSMYIKECARIMDIDEQVLMGEVARKRISVQGDSEAAEFIRKQSARQSVPAAVEYPSDLTAGSTAEELEKGA